MVAIAKEILREGAPSSPNQASRRTSSTTEFIPDLLPKPRDLTHGLSLFPDPEIEARIITLPKPPLEFQKKLEKKGQAVLAKQSYFDRNAVPYIDDYQVARCLLRLCKTPSTRGLKECVRMMGLSDTQAEIEEQFQEFKKCQDQIRRFIPRVLCLVNESSSLSIEQRSELLGSLNDVAKWTNKYNREFYSETLRVSIDINSKIYREKLETFLASDDLFKEQNKFSDKGRIIKLCSDGIFNKSKSTENIFEARRDLANWSNIDPTPPLKRDLVQNFFKRFNAATKMFDIVGALRADSDQASRKLAELSRGMESVINSVYISKREFLEDQSVCSQVPPTIEPPASSTQPEIKSGLTSLWGRAKSIVTNAVKSVSSKVELAVDSIATSAHTIAESALRLFRKPAVENFWLKALLRENTIAQSSQYFLNRDGYGLVKIAIGDGAIEVYGEANSWLVRMKFDPKMGLPAHDHNVASICGILDLKNFVARQLKLSPVAKTTPIPLKIKRAGYDYIDSLLASF